MPYPRVTAVVWWRVQASHFKAVFGRANVAGYTKDFLQAPAAIRTVLLQMYPGRALPFEPITYQWPDGSFDGGKIYEGTDRLEVGQWTGRGAPHPWRVGDPTTDPIITLPGDPDAEIPGDADAEWEKLAPLGPWLMMVQLDGSQDELHLRAYLTSPPPLQTAGLALLPDQLRVLMTSSGGATRHDFGDVWFDPSDLRNPWRDSSGRDHLAWPSPGPSGARTGLPYRRADESHASGPIEPFEVDPDERDRATRAHAQTQNLLAETVRSRGRVPLSPDGEPLFDLAWEEPDGTLVVAEVKSVTPFNVERQLRLALGQLLRYQDLCAQERSSVRGLIVISEDLAGSDWRRLCTRLGIGLLSGTDLEHQLDEWLGE